MALNFGKDLFEKSIFKISPEDEQVGKYAGNRIIPKDDDDTITADTDTVTLTPIESALNTLELQEAAAITPGTYFGVKMDVFSDADGYLDTVDTGNTTAQFSTDKYKTWQLTFDYQGTTSNDPCSSFNVTITAKVEGFISYMKLSRYSGEDSTFRFDIKQGGNTLATKEFETTGIGGATITFVEGDYSGFGLIQAGTFSIEVTRLSGNTTFRTRETETTDNPFFSFSNQEIWVGQVGGVTYTRTNKDGIVQTDAQTTEAGFEHFHIIGFRPTTTGTSTITADISFNGGTNYQEGVALNTNHSINYTGTSMILKLNLAAGTGAAECKGWGVQLW